MKISNRLAKVSGFVQQGGRLLDVGSDHAYLPIHLVERGRVHFAVAGEISVGPYQSAKQNIRKHGLSGAIRVRLADGLSVLKKSDRIDTITITGMGGHLIKTILEVGQEKLSSITRLILQPNNNEGEVRYWLNHHGWKILEEEILEENEKFYEILLAIKGEQDLDDKDLQFGPHLLRENSDIFQAHWKKEFNTLSCLLSKIPDKNILKRLMIVQKLKNIEEVLNVSQSNH